MSELHISQKIFDELKEHAREAKERKSENGNAFSLIFKNLSFGSVKSVIEKTIENFEGEKIICEINHGKIIDLGKESFEIVKGMLFELYDYKNLSSCFLRLYEIREKGKERAWVSCYIDENLLSPWWSKEERDEA